MRKIETIESEFFAVSLFCKQNKFICKYILIIIEIVPVVKIWRINFKETISFESHTKNFNLD